MDRCRISQANDLHPQKNHVRTSYTPIFEEIIFGFIIHGINRYKCFMQV